MYTTIVTIGRNFRGELTGRVMPLDSTTWETFIDEVHEVVLAEAAMWIESAGWDTNLAVFRGVSVWQGVAEDSATFQLLHDIEFDANAYESIRNSLKLLAARYQQEAIALIGNVRADLVPPRAGMAPGIPEVRYAEITTQRDIDEMELQD